MSTRVIKFRAWDERQKRIVGVSIRSSGLPILSGYNVLTTPTKRDDLHVMQFTGLHDKNGVEIYEGDIIRMEGGSCYDMEDPDPFTRQVMWCNDIGGLTHFRVDGKPSGSGLTWCRENAKTCFTVIGNIYESPELLER